MSRSFRLLLAGNSVNDSRRILSSYPCGLGSPHRGARLFPADINHIAERSDRTIGGSTGWYHSTTGHYGRFSAAAVIEEAVRVSLATIENQER